MRPKICLCWHKVPFFRSTILPISIAMKPQPCLLFALILFSGMLYSCKLDESNPILFTVGRYSITAQDVELVRALNALQPGMDTSYGAALYQLRRTCVYRHIADSMGVPITDSLLMLEAKRIARNTLIPRRLDSIRQYCNDSLKYIRYFVLPQLAPRWLYEQLMWNKEAHRTQRDSAQYVIQEWHRLKSITLFEKLSGKGLQYLARKYHYSYIRYQLDSSGEMKVLSVPVGSGRQPNVPTASRAPERIRWSMEEQMWQQQQSLARELTTRVLSHLQIGQLFPQPIELHDSFWVLQLIDHYRGRYYFDVLQIPKKDFFHWLHERGYRL